MKKPLRGIVHVHSNYSYDGHNSLEEIARYARTRGYHFVGMTEHSDTFDRSRMRDYVQDCARMSTSECLLIPGIYLWVAFKFTLPLVIDKGLDFWTAMQISRKMISRHWWKFFGLSLLLLAMRSRSIGAPIRRAYQPASTLPKFPVGTHTVGRPPTARAAVT